MTTLAERLTALDARIADAARAVGRDPGELTRIVVTKFHPARLVVDLAALGVHDVGESRQQELTAKRGETTDAVSDVRWHFIGQLQTKKAKAVRAASDCVHSVDRDRVADALHAADPEGSPLDVFLQVNLTDDPAPWGSGPERGRGPGDAHRRAVRVAAPSRRHGRRSARGGARGGVRASRRRGGDGTSRRSGCRVDVGGDVGRFRRSDRRRRDTPADRHRNHGTAA